MVDFRTTYTPAEDPPDQFAPQPVASMPRGSDDIEEPIIPIGEIGTTVADHLPTQNILQNIDASIRIGTKKIQLVIQGGTGGPGGFSASYGKDIRKEIRERTKAAGVTITGVELAPTRIQGMTGWDPRSGTISEEQRMEHIDQVKQAVKFAADIAGGGGVDIFANEFQRDVLDATWNKKKEFYDFTQDELTPEGEKKAQLVKYLMDKRTGRLLEGSIIRTSDKFQRVKYKTAKDEGLAGKSDANGHVLQPDDPIDFEGNYVNPFERDALGKLIPKMDPKTKEFDIETWDWNRVKEEAKKYNAHRPKGERELSPEEFAFRQRLQTQMALARGQSFHYNQDLDIMQAQLKELAATKRFVKDAESKMSPEEKKKWIEESFIPMLGGEGRLPAEIRKGIMEKNPSEVVDELIQRTQMRLHGYQEQSQAAAQQVEELKEVWNSVETPMVYARDKTWDSYAKAGVYAYEVTKERGLKKPVYIGPEIGWAGKSYGGHPDEFIEIVTEARKKMAKELEEQKGLNAEAAAKAAKAHIKGMMDTTHLSMWYKHYARKPGESEKDHLNRFNGWMKTQVAKMAEAGVLGGVQVLDAQSGDHAHLPVGQGIFDMSGIVKTLKNAGFEGDIISEGHEEEGYGRGRMLTETWKAMGNPVETYAGPRTWGQMQHGYTGHMSPARYVTPNYLPSQDFSPWSETPLE